MQITSTKLFQFKVNQISKDAFVDLESSFCPLRSLVYSFGGFLLFGNKCKKSATSFTPRSAESLQTFSELAILLPTTKPSSLSHCVAKLVRKPVGIEKILKNICYLHWQSDSETVFDQFWCLAVLALPNPVANLFMNLVISLSVVARTRLAASWSFSSGLMSSSHKARGISSPDKYHVCLEKDLKCSSTYAEVNISKALDGIDKFQTRSRRGADVAREGSHTTTHLKYKYKNPQIM